METVFFFVLMEARMMVSVNSAPSWDHPPIQVRRTLIFSFCGSIELNPVTFIILRKLKSKEKSASLPNMKKPTIPTTETPRNHRKIHENRFRLRALRYFSLKDWRVISTIEASEFFLILYFLKDTRILLL